MKAVFALFLGSAELFRLGPKANLAGYAGGDDVAVAHGQYFFRIVPFARGFYSTRGDAKTFFTH